MSPIALVVCLYVQVKMGSTTTYVAAKGRPQKMKGGGMDEDIYGSHGEGGEGIYDDTRGGKSMRYSEDGLYDNPHAGKGLCTHARTHPITHTMYC